MQQSGSQRTRASSTAQHGRLGGALALGIILGSGALLTFVAYTDPRILDRLYNSDILLPTSYFWNVRHDPASWTSFQLARVPAIVPDLAGYGAIDRAVGSYRAAIFGYSVFQCIAFVC